MTKRRQKLLHTVLYIVFLALTLWLGIKFLPSLFVDPFKNFAHIIWPDHVLTMGDVVQNSKTSIDGLVDGPLFWTFSVFASLLILGIEFVRRREQREKDRLARHPPRRDPDIDDAAR